MISSPIHHGPRPYSPLRLVHIPIQSTAIKYGFVILLLLLTFPYPDFVHIPSAGIDNSWRIALELIQQKNLVWGQDVIFTYGPLGRWLQRYVITTHPVELVVVDTFFALNLACLLYSFLPKPLKIWHLLVIFSILAIVNSMWGEWIHFTWFYLVIYWGIRSIYQLTPSPCLLYYTGIVCTINFFMKVNFGLFALGFMITLVSYLFLEKRISQREYGSFLGFLGLLLVAGAHWLSTDLIRYVTSSFHVISGYNESQALYPTNRLRLLFLSYGAYILQLSTAIVYLTRLFWLKRFPDRGQRSTLFVLFWTLLLSFVVLKYAFTRADDGHLTAFIKQSSLLLVLIVVYVQEDWLRKMFFAFLLFNCSAYLIFYTPIFGKVPVNYGTIFVRQVQWVAHYFQMAATVTYPPAKSTIPAPIRQKIGHQTVDVIPYAISDIYFNGLNYSPRPTLQSYQSYNGYLDQKNRAKYLSANAPDWIIYRYEAIDGKYPLADETQTLLAVIQRYQIDDQTPNQLFLKKNPHAKSLKLISRKTLNLRLGDTFHLTEPDTLLHVLYAKINYTIYGHLLALFFQPPQLMMRLCTENNSAVYYRTNPVLLKKGLLVNARVDNLADAREFLATQRVRNKRLTDLSFHQTTYWKPGFKSVIELAVHSYLIPSPKSRYVSPMDE